MLHPKRLLQLHSIAQEDEIGYSQINQSPQKIMTVTHQTYHAKIYVTLRPSVLDPAGAAVQSGLGHLGYDNVAQIRIGKYIELTITAETQAIAEAQVARMCEQLLANTVVENYRFELKTAVETVAAGA